MNMKAADRPGRINALQGLRACSFLAIFFSHSVDGYASFGAAVLILTTALGLNTSIMVRGFRMLPLFVLEALCGTELVLQLGRLPLFRFLCPVGENSLVIYGTHSLFYVIIGHWLSFDFTAISLGNGLLVLFFVALVEVPTVLFINRFLPFLAGKRYPRRKSNIHSTS